MILNSNSIVCHHFDLKFIINHKLKTSFNIRYFQQKSVLKCCPKLLTFSVFDLVQYSTVSTKILDKKAYSKTPKAYFDSTMDLLILSIKMFSFLFGFDISLYRWNLVPILQNDWFFVHSIQSRDHYTQRWDAQTLRVSRKSL